MNDEVAQEAVDDDTHREGYLQDCFSSSWPGDRDDVITDIPPVQGLVNDDVLHIRERDEGPGRG